MSKPTHLQYYPKSTQQTKDTIQKQQLGLCRICFQQMQLTSAPNVCKCHSSHSPIHEHCLSEWITSAVMHEDSFFSYYINCNVCKSRIYLETEASYKCKPLRKIDFCRQERCCTFLMVFVMLVGLGMVGMSVMLLENALNDDMISILAYIGLVIGSIISVLDTFCIVYFMLLTKQVKAKGIKGLQLKQYSKSNQNNPQTPKTPQHSDDSYANLQIQITSEQMLEDITED